MIPNQIQVKYENDDNDSIKSLYLVELEPEYPLIKYVLSSLMNPRTSIFDSSITLYGSGNAYWSKQMSDRFIINDSVQSSFVVTQYLSLMWWWFYSYQTNVLSALDLMMTYLHHVLHLFLIYLSGILNKLNLDRPLLYLLIVNVKQRDNFRKYPSHHYSDQHLTKQSVIKIHRFTLKLVCEVDFSVDL